MAKPKQRQVHLRNVLAAVAERARAEEDSQFVDSQPVTDAFPSPHIDQSNAEARDSLVILDEKGKKRVEKEQRREKDALTGRMIAPRWRNNTTGSSNDE